MSNKNRQIKKPLLHRVKHHFWMIFVPHRKNNYIPHLIRSYGVITIFVLVVGLQLGYNFTKTGSVLGDVTTVTPTGLLADTNQSRAQAGLDPLKLNDKLSQAAQLKAHDMLAKQYWAHVSPTGVQPWQWIDNTGYSYQAAGENLAKDFHTASAVESAWLASPEHRANVLKAAYREVGFAVVDGTLQGKPTTLVVALYAEPAVQLVSASTTPVASATAGPSTNFLDSQQITKLNLAERFGVALQSLNPAVITSLALLFIAATVAITTHLYRRKLPKRLQKTWYQHHGAVKATGFLVAAAIVVLLYGGGQI